MIPGTVFSAWLMSLMWKLTGQSGMELKEILFHKTGNLAVVSLDFQEEQNMSAMYLNTSEPKLSLL